MVRLGGRQVMQFPPSPQQVLPSTGAHTKGFMEVTYV